MFFKVTLNELRVVALNEGSKFEGNSRKSGVVANIFVHDEKMNNL